MGKAGKLRKKRKLEVLMEQGESNVISEQRNDLLNSGISLSQEDFAICARVLKSLQNPSLWASKEAKVVRYALHCLGKGNGTIHTNGDNGIIDGINSSLSTSISDALHVGDWGIAAELLGTWYTQHKHPPKLGSLCRWVRDCDALATGRDEERCQALDAILRTCDPSSIAFISKNSLDDPTLGDFSIPLAGEYYASSDSGTDWSPALEVANLPASFQVCLHEKGPLRSPPNLYDLHIWSCPESFTAQLLKPAPVHGKATLVPVPFVPHACMLANFMSAAECQRFITMAETVTFEADQPMGTGKDSVLAHVFCWTATQAFVDNLWERVQEVLPAAIMNAGAMGINRRFRCYRYVPGAVYRPHIDGAWPLSGLDSAGNYVYDAFPSVIWSKYTFLIYLNDGFSGGCTSFYAPSSEVGQLEKRGIKPSTGCALVFPHGDNIPGCMPSLHEGSPVLSGTKYVIRTEIVCKL